MDRACSKCGGAMQAGYLHTRGLMNTNIDSAQLMRFVVPGDKTSANPIRAFKQGLGDAPGDQVFFVEGYRCSTCGGVEFYAIDHAPH